MVYESNYLMHHGIKGQKWGVENGPPYPLSYKDYSAAEKRKVAISDKMYLLKQHYNENMPQINRDYKKFHDVKSISAKINTEKEVKKSIEDLKKQISKMPKDAKEFNKFISNTVKDIDKLVADLDKNKIKDSDILDKYEKFDKKRKATNAVSYSIGGVLGAAAGGAAAVGAIYATGLPVLSLYLGSGLALAGLGVGGAIGDEINKKAEDKLQEYLDEKFKKK